MVIASFGTNDSLRSDEDRQNLDKHIRDFKRIQGCDGKENLALKSEFAFFQSSRSRLLLPPLGEIARDHIQATKRQRISSSLVCVLHKT